jgi:hypothetical protein
LSAADSDYWLLIAPVVGGTINVAVQLLLARLFSGQRLVLVIVGALGAGLAASAAMIVWALSRVGLPATDAIGLAASALGVYLAGSFVLFAIVNLGETSLRIRMMRVLLDNPEGVTRDDLVASYDDRALVSVRLDRLRDNAQARVVDDVYYSRPSFMFFGAAGIRLLQRMVYGRR